MLFPVKHFILRQPQVLFKDCIGLKKRLAGYPWIVISCLRFMDYQSRMTSETGSKPLGSRPTDRVTSRKVGRPKTTWHRIAEKSEQHERSCKLMHIVILTHNAVRQRAMAGGLARALAKSRSKSVEEEQCDLTRNRAQRRLVR